MHVKSRRESLREKEPSNRSNRGEDETPRYVGGRTVVLSTWLVRVSGS